MTSPTEILKQEHRIIERGLRALGGLCARLGRGEPVPAQALAQLLDFIRSFADRFHHQKEEDCLFPALEARGVPREGGPIGVMLYEHETGRRLTAEMAQAAEEYGNGEPEAGYRLVGSASRYIELLSAHIQKEDNILFMVAENLFDERAQAELRQAFEQAEAASGANLRERYERIGKQLETDWAV
jgi:hemerythrin-like domain-containing protein